VHEERERVRAGGCSGSRGRHRLGSKRDDLDLPGLELCAYLGELLLVEIVLERERLQGGLLDRCILLRLLEERGDSKFKRGAQSCLTSFVSSVSGERRAFATNDYNGLGGRCIPELDQKNSPSRFRFRPLRPVDLPLARTALR
jgi:hypothetical protein